MKNTGLIFEERYTLQCRGAIEGLEPEPIDSLLVSPTPVAMWVANRISYGHDDCSLFAAWRSGDRAWLLREVWSPARGYSAWGTQDTILGLEAGIRILVECGRLDSIFGENPRIAENTRFLAECSNYGNDRIEAEVCPACGDKTLYRVTESATTCSNRECESHRTGVSK